MTTSTDLRLGVNATAAIKVACIAASTGNLTLEAEQTVDGIALTEDDRCFAKDQTDATEIGIYIVSTGTWTRAPDFDGSFDIGEGTIVPVSRGTTNADTYWRLTNTGEIVVGTTEITVAATTVLSSAILNDGSVKMIADLAPNVTDTYDLGTTLLKWEDFHLNGNALVGGTMGVTGAATFSGNITYGSVVQPPVRAAVTSHIRAGNTQIWDNDSASASVGDLDGGVTEATWESVGPTGSGADYVWDALDVLPSQARILIVIFKVTANSGAGGIIATTLYVTNGDSSNTSTVDNQTLAAQFEFDADAAGEQFRFTDEIHIPLNSSQVFRVRWSSDASVDTVHLIYRGFITD